MSQEQSELWKQAHAAFAAHRIPPIDPDAQAALNRIAAKCLRISFDDTNCTIRDEVLDFDSLSRLNVFRTKDVPARYDEPIVVLSFKGERYVIDGNKRVNAWLKTCKPQTRRAIVIEPTEAGYANWLMRSGRTSASA